MKADETVICEYGISPEEATTYEVQKPFYMRTCDGPLELVKKKQRVLLGRKFGFEMFHSGKATPVALGDTFEVIRPFQTAGENGEWNRLQPGDVVKLDRDEAIRFLREGIVKEKKGGKP